MHWNVGDRIIISAHHFSYGHATHWLVNLDHGKNPSNARAELSSPGKYEELKLNDFHPRPNTFTNIISLTKIEEQDADTIFHLSNGVKLSASKALKGWKEGDHIDIVVDQFYPLGFWIKNLNLEKNNIMHISGTDITSESKILAMENGRLILANGHSIWMDSESWHEARNWGPGDPIVYTIDEASGWRGEISNLNPKFKFTDPLPAGFVY